MRVHRRLYESGTLASKCCSDSWTILTQTKFAISMICWRYRQPCESTLKKHTSTSRTPPVPLLSHLPELMKVRTTVDGLYTFRLLFHFLSRLTKETHIYLGDLRTCSRTGMARDRHYFVLCDGVCMYIGERARALLNQQSNGAFMGYGRESKDV